MLFSAVQFIFLFWLLTSARRMQSYASESTWKRFVIYGQEISSLFHSRAPTQCFCGDWLLMCSNLLSPSVPSFGPWCWFFLILAAKEPEWSLLSHCLDHVHWYPQCGRWKPWLLRYQKGWPAGLAPAVWWGLSAESVCTTHKTVTLALFSLPLTLLA